MDSVVGMERTEDPGFARSAGFAVGGGTERTVDVDTGMERVEKIGLELFGWDLKLQEPPAQCNNGGRMIRREEDGWMIANP